ncbi:MAG: hypothetical protein U0736_06990 [Gemmataceae bacterium]
MTLVLSVFKLACARSATRGAAVDPAAGLLGSLAAIALALIAFLPMLLDGIAGGAGGGDGGTVVILITLVAHRELPGRFPGALAAVLLGVVLYLIGRLLEGAVGIPWRCAAEDDGRRRGLAAAGDAVVLEPGRRLVGSGVRDGVPPAAGGCCRSRWRRSSAESTLHQARDAGDEYDTRAILLTEGAASLAAGMLGGVIQTTPYIGHPAYKKMGGRSATRWRTPCSWASSATSAASSTCSTGLPTAAMFPILVFVGLEITAQSFRHDSAALSGGSAGDGAGSNRTWRW